jgi:tight adherence protein C
VTAATACAVSWVVLVAAIGWRRRPRSTRVVDGAPTGSRSPSLVAAVGRLAGSIGAGVRRRLHRPDDPQADRRVGALVLASGAALLVWPPLALVVPLVGALLPRSRARREARRQADLVADELPEVVDLLTLAAGAGLTAMLAVGVAVDRGSGPVRTALGSALHAVQLGSPPDAAFATVVAELGEPVRPLVAALLSSTRDGTPLEPALERAGHEARLLRRRRAEAMARRVPVKLLFPLVLCTLPAFALLTVVPLLVAALGSLHA